MLSRKETFAVHTYEVDAFGTLAVPALASAEPYFDRGGDYGYITATDTVDSAWVSALFKLPLNGMTGVILGSDGTYRIGKVTDIVPAKTDPNYAQKLQQAGVNLSAYRTAIQYNLIAQKLQTAITKQATTGNIEQVHAWEIEIASTDAKNCRCAAATRRIAATSGSNARESRSHVSAA